MANIEITDFCNMRCVYCFAHDHMEQPHPKGASRYISMEAFEKHLDFLDRSNIDQIRLIGGEPTLHPQFSEIIDRSQRRKKQIVLFSNGIMPKKALDRISEIPPEECTILVNMSASNAKGKLSSKENEIQHHSIFTLGKRIVLGYNIYKTNFSIDPLFPLITAAGSKKEIRLGLAHPTSSGTNKYLNPKQYTYVGKKIVQAAMSAAEFGISLSFDCGFVRCMFSEEDVQILKELNTDIGWRCNPILDITMDNRAIHCYPLAEKIAFPLSETSNATSLRDEFINALTYLQPIGIYPECSSCSFKISGECTGGCLGSAYQRLRHTPTQIAVPADKLTDR